MPKGFTIELKIDFVEDIPEREGGTSFWQWSVSSIKNKDGVELANKFVVQREARMNEGGLKALLGDLYNHFPVFLRGNNLKHD